MPQLNKLSLTALLGASLVVATPDLAASLSATVSSMVGSSILPMQNGFAQYEGILSPATFGKVNTRLLNLPTRSSTPLTTPVSKAFAAAQLSSDNSDKAALADAQSCISDILSRGSIPEGYVCADENKNTLSTYQTSFNTVLEQFVGIVPPSTMTQIQTQFNTYFASLGLIPPMNDMNTHIQNVIASITASNSGELVAGTQRLQDCFKDMSSAEGGLQKNYQCFVGKDSAMTSMQTLFAGILQQAGGYLPPNLVQDIINTYMYFLTAAGVTPGLTLMEPLNNAIMSMTAAVSGNSVTAIQQMQQCFNDVIMTPTTEARSTYECVMAADGPIRTLQILINGIIQQSFGYLPPTLILALEHDLRPLLKTDSPSADLISKSMKQTFDASATGPEFTTCFLALEDCVNEGVLTGSSATCELQNKCKALAET